MTRYCVSIARWYEVEATDEEEAQELAHAIDDVGSRPIPIVNVTDLDAESRISAGNSTAKP